MQFNVELSDDQIDKIRRKIDPDLLKEKDLKDKLKALRNLTEWINKDISEKLGEKKRTFESWVSGRYTPESDKMKKINALLVFVAVRYIEAVLEQYKPSNAYTGFPEVFKLLDFNDAITVLMSIFKEKGKDIDYESGTIS
jgi:ribosome-binding protein aMBF1 (putative translation factor)